MPFFPGPPDLRDGELELRRLLPRRPGSDLRGVPGPGDPPLDGPSGPVHGGLRPRAGRGGGSSVGRRHRRRARARRRRQARRGDASGVLLGLACERGVLAGARGARPRPRDARGTACDPMGIRHLRRSRPDRALEHRGQRGVRRRRAPRGLQRGGGAAVAVPVPRRVPRCALLLAPPRRLATFSRARAARRRASAASRLSA